MDSMEQAFNKQFEAMNLQNRWHDQKTPLNPHIGKKAQATSSLWAQINWMGFNFTIAKTQRSNCHDFTLRLRTGIPFAEYIFQLEYSFRKYAFCGLMSPLPSGGYGFSRVIADDSEFMAACLSGDLAVVKDLCRNGSARLDDVSKKNMTPLMYAVEGGDVDTVAFLLDNGASPNWLGGSRQTSPIQWAIKNDRLDIARILIQRGADLHHVSTLGWTPLFYCWAQLYANQSKKTDILKLLAEYSCLELEVLDTKEWTVLQRASAFGTAEDVNVLLKLGANPFTKTTGLQWQGIHYAIAAGNQTTFEELLPKYASEDLQVVDERGWSLLHIAAQAGHQSLIRALLDNGADPYAKSKPTRFYVPEELCDRTCTPGDVACGMDSAIQRRYLDVLAEFSLLAQPCADPSDETGEVFFDAVE
ncbi:ankyrin [Tothia fuscella]|uniref:Ankyrin n=1 Tax=Tothia fuscella TaxID=1048955 RepID=A0A9P4NF40_9PEZI|nr:ankyrin [Tothia fuscella]